MPQSKESWRKRLVIGALIALGSVGVAACGDVNASGFSTSEKAKLESTIHPEAQRIAKLVMAKDKKPMVSHDGTLFQYSIGNEAANIGKPHREVYVSTAKHGKDSNPNDVTKIIVTNYENNPNASEAVPSTQYTLSLETGAQNETYWSADETFYDEQGKISQIYSSDSINHSDQVSSNQDAINHAAQIVNDLQALEPTISRIQ